MTRRLKILPKTRAKFLKITLSLYNPIFFVVSPAVVRFTSYMKISELIPTIWGRGKITSEFDYYSSILLILKIFKLLRIGVLFELARYRIEVLRELNRKLDNSSVKLISILKSIINQFSVEINQLFLKYKRDFLHMYVCYDHHHFNFEMTFRLRMEKKQSKRFQSIAESATAQLREEIQEIPDLCSRRPIYIPKEKSKILPNSSR